ncbi:MAG: hypothetical protein M2R45_00954 [Verrucomicrobia subdivision 3 bacterium]|nr:hypothetical protein [Limisphaerales bacterium]MCS1414622.1 hypothetical protein [Limisphaerales bacterium]
MTRANAQKYLPRFKKSGLIPSVVRTASKKIEKFIDIEVEFIDTDCTHGNSKRIIA